MDGTIKRKSPWAVIGLSLITLGIYQLIWYHRVNRELNSYGHWASPQGQNALAVNPGVALLAVTLGAFLILPAFVSLHRTFGRIASAERLGKIQGSHFSKGIGWLLAILALPFAIVFIALPFWAAYAQSHLNTLWATVSNATPRIADGSPSHAQEEPRRPAPEAAEDVAIQVLRERYARGEVTREEFKQALADLS